MATEDTPARARGNRPEVLAIIPARGGSKGIPGKNIADLGGKPLVAHSILSALRCPLVTRVVVSTDSGEIAEVARQWGAEAPFLRPDDLSHDTACVGDAVAHVLEVLRLTQGYAPEACITLYPTHPFRTSRLMDHLTSMLLAGYRHVRTVRRMRRTAFGHFVGAPGGGVRVLPGAGAGHGHYFRYYGLYVGENLRRHCARELYLHELESEEELLDIDEPCHLARANEILSRTA